MSTAEDQQGASASKADRIPEATSAAPGSDPVSHLSEVYRDYPGLRALILRRVRDPEAAADILQDAAVTTLEKLRSGGIAHPENVGGYLYRVALNHLRNQRRKDRTAAVNAAALEEPQNLEEDAEWERAGRPQWEASARRVLAELPTVRDRELLVRFYLKDEDKDVICAQLGLSREHFNRVIFRARNRFRDLLRAHGLGKSDLLALIAVTCGLAFSAAAPMSASSEPAQATHATQDARAW